MRSIALFSTSAAFGPLYASLLLGERVSPIQAGGGLLMALGVILIARREVGRVRRPELSPTRLIPGTAFGEPQGEEGARRP
jgi:drug/metabolite transporter (DMT)-like permease